MKKILVAFVVLAAAFAAYWWSRTPASDARTRVDASPSTNAGPVQANETRLSSEPGGPERAGAKVAPNVASAPAPEASSEAAPAQPLAGELRQDFLDFAPNLNHADLLGFREKIRTHVAERAAALHAERGGPPTRTVYPREPGADVWSVALREVPPGYIGFASPSGYDKEHGGEGFDLFLYPEDNDSEWANAQRELKWIEARLPNLPQ
jgi:hypothetical protein